MARCIDCQHYPWDRAADPAYLPAMRCHPALPMQWWPSRSQVEATHECPHYQALAADEPVAAVTVEVTVAAAPETVEVTVAPAPEPPRRGAG